VIEDIRNIKATAKKLRGFGLTLGGVAALVAGALFWQKNSTYPVFLILGIALIGSGAVYPRILKPLYLAWMTLAAILGWIMTRVILTILFYLVLTPIALAAKLLGKRFLDLKWKHTRTTTCWNDLSAKETKPDRYTHQF
jgi:ABC-type uncharacterized transport system permease subunit